MAITSKGKGWEVKHSLWIIWCFIFMLNGIGMCLAGQKVHIKKWRNFGLFYIAMAWISVYVAAQLEIKGMMNIADIVGSLFYITYLACIIHSFMIKREYLIKLEVLENEYLEQYRINDLGNKTVKDYNLGVNRYGVNTGNANIEYNPGDIRENIYVNKGVPVNYSFPAKDPGSSVINTNQAACQLLDINICTQEDFLQLPGIGIIEVKKAINYRNNNEFNSVEEFIEISGIKPHFAEKIRPMLACNKVKTNENRINEEDKNRSHMGRMVDF